MAALALDARSDPRATWAERFSAVRAASVALTAGLLPEDQTIQSMPDVSPTKWHLAHTTWFFETFVLAAYQPGYQAFDPAYLYLFNSYYQQVGPRHPRPERGLLSRPGVADIARYRAAVDAAVLALIARAGTGPWQAIAPLLELGLHHEQQHQELILMDIKHVFSVNPLRPCYRAGAIERRAALQPVPQPAPAAWATFAGGLAEIGHAGSGFAFDNEGPRHKVWLEPFRLATRAVTCGDYAAFIADGGYRRPEHWLSEGWNAVEAGRWRAPLYWDPDAGTLFTLAGMLPLDPAEPVCHVSFYEADAFARWAGKRLPSEAEWEIAAQSALLAKDLAGNFVDRGRLHPAPATGDGLDQLFGDVWEWTASAYAPYPGYRAAAGAIGEYNGKFMSRQMVLRGGCAVTPPGHVRTTYRNFFPPAARWAFSGIRLAEDV
jgi:ergothioneine biosynthesis protein EgtB